MRFSRKLLLWTTIIIALTLGLSGFYFVNYVFRTSLEREIGQALDENSILRFAFETAALNVPLKYDLLQDGSVEQIASNLETSGQGSGRLLRMSDEEKQPLYASDGFETDGVLWESIIISRPEAVSTHWAGYCIWKPSGMYPRCSRSGIQVLRFTDGLQC